MTDVQTGDAVRVARYEAFSPFYAWARARILDTVANLATHFQKL